MQEKIDNLCQLTGAMHHTIDVLIRELEKLNANPYVIKSAKDSVQRHRDKFQSIQAQGNTMKAVEYPDGYIYFE